MVHVLGVQPDGTGSTIYVIEPHAQRRGAVFADAPLPFDPVSVVDGLGPDVPDRRPPADPRVRPGAARSRASRSASTRSPGGVPGVLAGVADGGVPATSSPGSCSGAARSRSSSAIFALVDGMLFVQSRIGMNDAYVGLGIVAAYTLFAALWTRLWSLAAARSGSRCRSSASASGFALASKWVAAVRDRRDRAPDPRPERARPAARRSLALVAMTGRPRLPRDRRPGGRRARQPAVRRDHGRADGRARSSPTSSTRSPGRTTRCGSRSAAPVGARRARRRSSRSRTRRRRAGSIVARPVRGHADRRSPARLVLLGGRRLRRRSSSPARARLRAARAAPPRPTTRPRSCRRPHRRRARRGCGPARSSACRSSGWSSACSSSRSALYVVSYIPWALRREPPARRRLAGRPHGPDAARPDRARCTTTTTT